MAVSMNVCTRSTFSEFASKWARDSRFRAIEKMRERELLFGEFILEVRRQEETESRGQIERVSSMMSSNYYTFTNSSSSSQLEIFDKFGF